MRGVERIGGFGGKSDVLAASEVYLGSPDGHRRTQETIMNAVPADIHGAANEWLSQGALTIEVQPFPAYAAAETDVDRSSGPPEVTEFPSASFPARETTRLSNGLDVILARREAVPVIDFNLLLDAGYAADQLALPGTARMTMDMLDEGTASRTALEIAEALEGLGTTLSAGSNLDMSTVRMSTLKENLAASLDLFADVVLNPSFPQDEFDRRLRQQLAAIAREKVQPMGMAMRVFPRLLYGADHAYGQPLTGSGTERALNELRLDGLRAFHDTWFRPNNATLIVVGDVTMAELEPALEARFAGWEPGATPRKNLDEVGHQAESVIYLIDRPDSEQSIIFAGHVAPPKSDARDLQIETMNNMLGGGFTARINMNLREDKGWSYGAQSMLIDTAGQRPFFVFAPVQTDRTAESMAEIDKEISSIRSGGDRPPTAEELARVKDQRTLTLPGRWETNRAVMADIVEMVRFGLPDDYWATYAGTVRALTLGDVSAEADRILQPDRMIWVVVGDRARIEESVGELGLGEIRFLDADGYLIED